jgi:hypothetical protein
MAIFGLMVASMAIPIATSDAAVTACHGDTGKEIAVTVQSSFADPTYDFTRRQSELSGRPGLAGYRLMGLTEIEKTSRISVGIRYRHPQNHQGVCYDVADIQVTLIADPVRVYVATEHPKGSCPFKVTLSHENKHVAIERAALAQHAESLRQQLQRTGRHGWRHAASPGTAVQDAHQWVQTIVSATLRSMATETTWRHGRLDSPSNYQREHTLCRDAPAEASVESRL